MLTILAIMSVFAVAIFVAHPLRAKRCFRKQLHQELTRRLGFPPEICAVFFVLLGGSVCESRVLSAPSPASIRAKEFLTIEIPGDDFVRATHTIWFENVGQTPYAQPITWSIPRSAFSLTLLRGLHSKSIRMNATSPTVALTESILPGSENQLQIQYAYSYPYEKRSLAFLLPLSVSRTGFDLMILGKGIDVTTSQLTQQPLFRKDRSAVLAYSGGPFAAHEAIHFVLQGLPRKKDFAFAVLILSLFGVASIVLFLSFRFPFQLSFETWKSTQKEANLNELCALERDYKNDVIGYDVFVEKRENLHRRLWKLMKEQTTAHP